MTRPRRGRPGRLRRAVATSARVRLTLVITGVLGVTGAAIVATVGIVMSVLPAVLLTTDGVGDGADGELELLPTTFDEAVPGAAPEPGEGGSTIELPPGASIGETLQVVQITAVDETVRLLLTTSLVVLGVALVVGAVVAWFVSGRLLRPVAQLTEAARQIDHGSLHPMLDLGGRRDEFGRLAETIRDMLGRLDRSYQAQRRFAANASHELRTPLATTQALLDVALADPDSVDVVRLAGRLREVNARSAGTVSALLTLSDAQSGDGEVVEVDLAPVVRTAAVTVARQAQESGIALTTDLEPVVARGDPALLEVLVGNLVGNAVRHGRAGGVAHVSLRDGVLLVENDGDELTEDEVALFTEPFHRRAGRVPGSHGLGLALVTAVAEGHGAELRLLPREGGGLVATVAFPAATASPDASGEDRRPNRPRSPHRGRTTKARQLLTEPAGPSTDPRSPRNAPSAPTLGSRRGWTQCENW